MFNIYIYIKIAHISDQHNYEGRNTIVRLFTTSRITSICGPNETNRENDEQIAHERIKLRTPHTHTYGIRNTETAVEEWEEN